jgi:hypothetical protein
MVVTWPSEFSEYACVYWRRALAAPPDPKHHHYVPEMLQKRFVDADGWLHVYNRNHAPSGLYKGRPSSIFHQRHLYSEMLEDGTKDPSLERRLSRLEHLANGVIEKVVASARQGRPASLSAEERDIWYVFLAIQWKRVPDLHDQITTDAEALVMFDELIARTRQDRPQWGSQLDAMAQPQARRRMLQNARVGSLGTSPQIMEALRSRGMAVVRITRPAKQFVLASRPVIKLTAPGKTDLHHPECELWLPVAHDVAIGLGQGRHQVTLHPAAAHHVRQMNLAAASQSSILASGSPQLVLSLANPR